MKIYKNHTNNKDYLIAADKIYIAKGNIIERRKSLGSADSTKNKAYKKAEFNRFIINEEIKLRTEYWRKHVQDARFSKYVSVEKLERLRANLYHSKENMGAIADSAMEMAFLVDFVYNSNRIEGSKLPRESVEHIIKEGKSQKNNEVTNTVKAINRLDETFTFNIKQIERLHAVALAHEPDKTGLRREPVVVGNTETSDWRNIRSELQAVLDQYHRDRYKVYAPELAFRFYYQFERIHPFVDGNGRVGRLLMNKILKDHYYHPMIIWNKREQAHLAAFRKSMDGRRELFYKFMAEQFVKTYEIYLDKIEKAFNLEEQMRYFMTPSSYNF